MNDRVGMGGGKMYEDTKMMSNHLRALLTNCLTLMEDIDSEDDVSLYHGLRIRRVTVAVSNVVCQRCNYNVKFETLLYNTREFGFAHGENCRTRNASKTMSVCTMGYASDGLQL